MAGVDSYTKLVLHFGLSEGDTERNIDFRGDCKLISSDKKFGTSCLDLGGTDSYLFWNENSDFNLGSGDWTVEMFIKFDTVPSSSDWTHIFTRKEEYGWTILSNTTESAGSYEVNLGGSDPGSLTIVARKSDGETNVYGDVDSILST